MKESYYFLPKLESLSEYVEILSVSKEKACAVYNALWPGINPLRLSCFGVYDDSSRNTYGENEWELTKERYNLKKGLTIDAEDRSSVLSALDDVLTGMDKYVIEDDTLCEVYYNPDSNEGHQIVWNYFDIPFETIEREIIEGTSVSMFCDAYLVGTSAQTCYLYDMDYDPETGKFNYPGELRGAILTKEDEDLKGKLLDMYDEVATGREV